MHLKAEADYLALSGKLRRSNFAILRSPPAEYLAIYSSCLVLMNKNCEKICVILKPDQDVRDIAVQIYGKSVAAMQHVKNILEKLFDM
uniref:Uncharacterized protein n=1 Tax=Panagrolaimus sp. ES5 TaxID=591445 RepID=A0AC34G5E4_9BILA